MTRAGEIIVTAQRRNESLQKVAVPVAVVTGNDLINNGVVKPNDLTSVVPALQISTISGPLPQFYLRGVGNAAGNALADPAVALGFNGVYISRGAGTNGFFYDVDRIEVLKGPQGTLYGRNATGGAINILPRRPKLGQAGFEGSFEYGNYDAVRAEVAADLPISGDKAALRVASVYQKHDGYLSDGTDDQDDFGMRATLLLEPSADLTITTIADYYQMKCTGTGNVFPAQGIKNRIGATSAEGTAFLVTQPNVLLRRGFSPLNGDKFQDNDFWGIATNIEWKMGIGTVTLLPAHRESKLDYASFSTGFYLSPKQRDRQTSVELRLASDDTSSLKYLVGAFYFTETNDIERFYVNQQTVWSNQIYKQTNDAYAAFASLTWSLAPTVRLTAGGRYTSEKKHFNSFTQQFTRPCVVPFPAGQSFPYPFAVPVPNFGPPANGTLTLLTVDDLTGANAKSVSFDKWTYRLSGEWDIGPQNLLYATFETGFKSGGFNVAVGDIFAPESIKAWTIGSKNRFLDNKLQLNLEGFYWTYRDQQFSHLTQLPSGRATFLTENIGKATVKGFEVEGRYRASSNTELNATLQYVDARYDNFIYTTPNQNGGVSNGTSCPNASVSANIYTVNCSGNRPLYAPVWAINLGISQDILLANDSKFNIRASTHYQSESLTGTSFLPREIQPSYWLVNGSVSYSFPGERITITAYGNNLTNKTLIGNSGTVTFGLHQTASLRPPRTYGARLGVKF